MPCLLMFPDPPSGKSSSKSSKTSTPRSFVGPHLGDKLQRLAMENPTALILVERFVDKLITDPHEGHSP
jgi:hypothetical protein